MPIWFELMVMLLVTYFIGIVIGWVLWGREITAKIGTKPKATENIPDTEEESF